MSEYYFELKFVYSIPLHCYEIIESDIDTAFFPNYALKSVCFTRPVTFRFLVESKSINEQLNSICAAHDLNRHNFVLVNELSSGQQYLVSILRVLLEVSLQTNTTLETFNDVNQDILADLGS